MSTPQPKPERIYIPDGEADAFISPCCDQVTEYIRANLANEVTFDERTELELRRLEGKTVTDILGLPETTTIDEIVATLGRLKDSSPLARNEALDMSAPFIDLLNWYTHELAVASTTLTITEVVEGFNRVRALKSPLPEEKP